MSDQLPSWLSVIVEVPCAVVAIIHLCGLGPRRRHRRAVRITHVRVWCIAWTRLDVSDDDQLKAFLLPATPADQRRLKNRPRAAGVHAPCYI